MENYRIKIVEGGFRHMVDPQSGIDWKAMKIVNHLIGNPESKVEIDLSDIMPKDRGFISRLIMRICEGLSNNAVNSLQFVNVDPKFDAVLPEAISDGLK